MIRVREAFARHPLGADAGVAILLALADAPGAVAGAASAGGWVWFATVHLPLVWRRRYPSAVFWAVFVVAVAAWAVAGIDSVYPYAALLAATATLTRYRPWRWWWPAVTAIAVVLGTGWYQNGLRFGDLAALAAGLAAAVLLGVTVRTRQAYVTERERRAAAAERSRIAREVHDVVAHNVAVMVALADGAALAAAAAPERAVATLGTIAATGREALDDLHRLLGLLRDPSERPEFRPQPGLDDLDQLVAQVRDAGLRATVVRNGTPGPWGPAAELTIYRLVQESLTNTLKHAGPATTVGIHLRYGDDEAELDITDDGGAAPEHRQAGGHGLAGMLERVAAYDGQVDAGPLPTGGWHVHATLHFGRLGRRS